MRVFHQSQTIANTTKLNTERTVADDICRLGPVRCPKGFNTATVDRVERVKSNQVLEVRCGGIELDLQRPFIKGLDRNLAVEINQHVIAPMIHLGISRRLLAIGFQRPRGFPVYLAINDRFYFHVVNPTAPGSSLLGIRTGFTTA